jgi:hypothetical protein
VKCPLYARAIDIFSGLCLGTATANYGLPTFKNKVQKSSSKMHEPGAESHGISQTLLIGSAG